ncbi:MAG: chorismate mutase [Clostridia bacterium]|nr:chorismate mutase [Clostridia bacterium]
MDITEYRKRIDEVDRQLVGLFEERMRISAGIAEYKKERGLPALDASRERAKLAEISKMSAPEFRSYNGVLFSQIMELSKAYQQGVLRPDCELKEQILAAIEHTDRLFPEYAPVACQGVEGAYSQQACDKLFKTPEIMYCKTWENVFAAVESGMCRFGVLPIENSTAGSVNKIYDLMAAHNFYIVRSVRLRVCHSLLAPRGVKKEDVKEIYSHEQAISQCAGFLRSLGGVQARVCENTAVAAKTVAESGRRDVAALSSHTCAELYGLSEIASSVQDSGSNYTRFICISKKMEIYPGADKTSVMVVTPNKPGALYKVLSRFFALGINLIKLESRPIPDRDFEWMFYFDLDTQVYSEQFVRLVCELDGLCDRFKYLGSYSEII